VRRTTLSILVALAPIAFASSAHADLRADAQRLARTWTARGARVEQLPPLFLEGGRVRSLPLDPYARSTATECTALVLLGERGAELTVYGVEALLEARRRGEEPARDRGDDPREDDGKTRSTAGALVLERCGAARSELTRLVVEMRSSRGAVEALLVRSNTRIGAVDDILPERAGGPPPPRGDVGHPLEPGPVAARLERAGRRAVADGARGRAQESVRASARGEGSFTLRLLDGCHRVEIMAEVPTTLPRRVTDIDAEVREGETSRLLARDRADAADARLDFCLGIPSPVEVSFVGASRAVQVTALTSTWPISDAVPLRWGPRARAGMASALSRRRAPVDAGRLLVQTLGVQGTTTVPLAVEPGSCYLAAVGLVRGETRGLRLTARIGGRVARDEVVERPEGAAVSFCAEGEDQATLEIEARGSSPWWVAATWALGAAPQPLEATPPAPGPAPQPQGGARPSERP
jgi:hypothetical protein